MSWDLSVLLPMTVGVAVSGALAWQVFRCEEVVGRRQLGLQVVLSAALIAALVLDRGPGSDLVVPMGFIVTAVPLAVVDWCEGRLPNWLTGLSALVVTASAVGSVLVESTSGGAVVRAVVGASLFLLLYGGLYRFVAGGIGGGDVKFSVVCGAVLCWASWNCLIAGLGLIWASHATVGLLAKVARQGASPVTAHGPFLVAGTVASLLLVW